MMSQDTFPGVRIGLVPWAGLARRSGTDATRAVGQVLAVAAGARLGLAVAAGARLGVAAAAGARLGVAAAARARLGVADVAGLGAGVAAAEAVGAAGPGAEALVTAGLGAGAAADVLGAVVRAPTHGPETFAESRTPPGRGTIITTSSSPATAKAVNQPTHRARGRSGGASQCLRWRPESVVRGDTTLLPVWVPLPAENSSPAVI
jgi:hypothetical protein